MCVFARSKAVYHVLTNQRVGLVWFTNQGGISAFVFCSHEGTLRHILSPNGTFNSTIVHSFFINWATSGGTNPPVPLCEHHCYIQLTKLCFSVIVFALNPKYRKVKIQRLCNHTINQFECEFSSVSWAFWMNLLSLKWVHLPTAPKLLPK